MGIGRVLATGSALSAVGVLVAAPIALAAAPSISVTKGEHKPNSRVEIVTECGIDGINKEPNSPVLDKVQRTAYDPQTAKATWAGVVKADAKAGEHSVSFDCDGRTLTANFVTVAGTTTTTSPRPTTTSPRPTTSPKVTTSTKVPPPKGAPETGGGGTADGGGNGLAIAGGATALAAGAGLGVWAVRRRRASAHN